MKNIVEYNKLKRLELMKKIINSDGNYRLFCIDVDDVVFNTEPFVQNILEGIDYRATNKYRTNISAESSEDLRDEMEKSFNILDAILEETLFFDYDDEKESKTIRSYKRINYDEVYKDENLFPGAVEFIRNMLANRSENDFFIFLSHRNPEREGVVKTKRLYELFPDVDAIETLPFHIPGTKKVSSKALWIKELYGLDNLNNCYLIDNTKKNGFEFRKHGGVDIRYLPNGFVEKDTLADHMSRLTSLDSHMIQFAISYIRYAKEHPEYIHKVDIPMDKVKRR